MKAFSKKNILCIAGPTAIGKTALSIELSKQYNAPILSCDSRQFYKEISIGTAVPSKEELAQAPHYFIQNRSIFEAYNVGAFERDALKKTQELFVENDLLILVGGSGLYYDALVNGLDYFPKVDPKIRRTLNGDLVEKGLSFLQDRLQKLDPESYKSIALDNPQRVIRALEICIGTGKTYASFKNKPKAPRPFNTVQIGLTAQRTLLYERINQRVDQMMENGLVEEAKKMHPHKALNALQTVGYRELFSFFEGKYQRNEAVEEIKKNTRRFAKRQMTWFRKNDQIHWFDLKTSLDKILKHINIQLG